MTALYESIEDTSTPLSPDERLGDGVSDVDEKKSIKQRKKKSTKKREPEYIILSPDEATRSANAQNFLFGTCSQLERDDSPTFFEETQKALQNSESITSGQAVPERHYTGLPSKSLAIRFTGNKSHWSVAARDLDGSMLQPEVIDMTDSPNSSTYFKRTTSETKHGVSKAKLSVPTQIAKSDLTINKNTQLRSIPETEIPPLTLNPKLSSVSRDVENPSEQPLIKPSHMPNFNGYTDAELSKQISAYGFKAIRGRKKMIDLLEKCWQNKHNKEKGTTGSIETSLAASSQISNVASSSVAKAQENPSEQSMKTKPPASGPNTTSRTEQRKKSTKSATKKTKKSEKSSQPAPSRFNTIDEIQDSEEELIPSPTRVHMQRQSSSRQPTPTTSSLSLGSKGRRPLAFSKLSNSSNNDPSLPDLHGQITKAIRLQPRPPVSSSCSAPQLLQRLTWHEKILLYDPIILEDLATWLNTEGLALVCDDREVSAGFVRGWCESQSICCTYRN